MPFTGGGNPLPTSLGCRWCAFQTANHRRHGAAYTDLFRHVKEAHPEVLAARPYERLVRTTEGTDSE